MNLTWYDGKPLNECEAAKPSSKQQQNMSDTSVAF